jgi:stearoyl-CoA desaturase (delta-9 desaturase)
MGPLIYTLLLTHFTIMCVTIYLHRGQAHKSLEFDPRLESVIRFWLWLTTGMVTKQWVAVHRKHHAFTDREGDPHSPLIYGLRDILFGGVTYYAAAAKDEKMVEQFGAGTPDDWIEKNIYTRFPFTGVVLMLIIDALLFGQIGVLIWLIQMIWIPFWAAGVINGVGHHLGYRNWTTKDHSTNIVPWGIIIGGEELHNNHHNKPASPKLSNKWYEFDIGWMWIKIFEKFNLIKIRKNENGENNNS